MTHPADGLVMDLLVRAAYNVDIRSIVGAKAQARLLKLAESENPALFEKTLKERAASIKNMSKLLSRVIGIPR